MGSEQKGIYFSWANVLGITGFIVGAVVWGIDLDKRVIANSTNITGFTGANFEQRITQNTTSIAQNRTNIVNLDDQQSRDRESDKEARKEIKEQLLGIDKKLDALLLRSSNGGF